METQQRTYALSHNQIMQAIIANRTQCALLEGEMGTGKSALLGEIGKILPDHTQCYFDSTTKDVGDIVIPKFKSLEGADYFTSATNEELGMHLAKPLILMIDEYEKANPAVKNALLRVILEGKIGTEQLHPESVRFATSNLGEEGLGDALMPHQENRVTRLRLRKPTNIEWADWGQANDINYVVSAWVLENEKLFQSFEHVRPDDNPYIYHPERHQRGFVTPRSLEAASKWMHKGDEMDGATLEATLVGTLGAVGGSELFNYSRLISELPTLESIKTSPTTALVPTGASAVIMVVYRTLQNIERDWVDAWLEYMARLPTSARSYFLNGIKAKDHPRQAIVMNNINFQKLAHENAHMFSADKRG